MISEGDSAPDFTLETDRGEAVRLSDYLGRRVVLYFYPRDGTSGCTRQACEFRDSAGGFEAMDAIVLGISPDSTASHARFRDKHGLNFTLLADPEREAALAYGVWGKKKLYGREYEGIHRTTFVVGPDGVVERVYRKVRPAGHAEAILADMSS
jgi:peroxiredoxin Q/BCP